MDFQEYLLFSEFALNHGSSIFSPLSNDLGLPTITKNGKILVLLQKKNPIYIQLSDGTRLFLTHDEFRRIHEKPEVGKNMTVVFQRLHGDKSDTPSQIQSCKCHD